MMTNALHVRGGRPRTASADVIRSRRRRVAISNDIETILAANAGSARSPASSGQRYYYRIPVARGAGGDMSFSPCGAEDDWPETRGPLHIRTPHYLRGYQGRILRFLGQYPNPEDLAFARPASDQSLYHLAFPLSELWPEVSSSKSTSIVATDGEALLIVARKFLVAETLSPIHVDCWWSFAPRRRRELKFASGTRRPITGGWCCRNGPTVRTVGARSNSRRSFVKATWSG